MLRADRKDRDGDEDRTSAATASTLPSAGMVNRRGRKVVSTGSHLSRLDHAGRWPVSCVTSSTSSR